MNPAAVMLPGFSCVALLYFRSHEKQAATYETKETAKLIILKKIV